MARIPASALIIVALRSCSALYRDAFDCDSLNRRPSQATWSKSMTLWCCHHKGIGCNLHTDDWHGSYDCQTDRSDWERGWSRQKKAWCCTHANSACQPYDCDTGWSSWHTKWTIEKRRYCCSASGRGCPHAPSPTAAPLTFDCKAGYAKWEKGWSNRKKDWCCQHEHKACERYDCNFGLQDWHNLWTASKHQWCCDHKADALASNLAKAVAKLTTGTADEHAVAKAKAILCPSLVSTTLVPLPAFDCSAGYTRWEKGWSSSKKVWCCENEHKACVPFNCLEGFKHWETDWTSEKHKWCCKDPQGPFCPASVAYDCAAGYSTWETGWSDEKKQWCCHREEKGCTPSYDCDQGYDTWQTSWDPKKREWCCQVRDCSTTTTTAPPIVTSTAPPAGSVLLRTVTYSNWAEQLQQCMTEHGITSSSGLTVRGRTGTEYTLMFVHDKAVFDGSLPGEDDFPLQIWQASAPSPGSVLLRTVTYSNWAEQLQQCMTEYGITSSSGLTVRGRTGTEYKLTFVNDNALLDGGLPGEDAFPLQIWQVIAISFCHGTVQECPAEWALAELGGYHCLAGGGCRPAAQGPFPSIDCATQCRIGNAIDDITTSLTRTMTMTSTITVTVTQTSVETTTPPMTIGAVTSTAVFDCIGATGWNPTKKAWCCSHHNIGCQTSANTTTLQNGFSTGPASTGVVTWTMTMTTTTTTTATIATTFDFDCKGAHAGWTQSLRNWCCEHKNIGCDTTTTPFDCSAGYPNWKTGWSEDKKSWCCMHYSRGCSTSTRTTSTTTTTWDCSAGYVNWENGWSDEKKTWCCMYQNKGCSTTTGTTTTTTTPWDCSAGYARWRTGWSDAKKEWCCFNENKGCSAKPFQCDFGFSWLPGFIPSIGWTVEKTEWCCKHEQKGCGPEADSDESSMTYDCQATNTNSWTDDQKAWCCDNQGLGPDCAAATSTETSTTETETSTTPPFDCAAGQAMRMTGWSSAKKKWCCDSQGVGCVEYSCNTAVSTWTDQHASWCCLHHGSGCTTTTVTTVEGAPRYNCSAGLGALNGWSIDKMHWCCAHESIGCEPFDCIAGQSNWERAWSTAKKDYCCTHEPYISCSAAETFAADPAHGPVVQLPLAVGGVLLLAASAAVIVAGYRHNWWLPTKPAGYQQPERES